MIQGLIKKGKVIGEVVPTPKVSDGCLLIKVVNSCISAGTEMSGVNNSGKPLIKRALEQPENVKKVLNYAKDAGLSKAFAKVKGVLDAGSPTGYSVSGVVVGIGKGVEDFSVGDRISAAGAGLANHAEYVDVPKNLVVKIPKDLSFEDASTVTLGSIALQGVRRANLKLGESCIVFGTGILGLLTVQILKASGVRVLAMDLDDNRLEIAKKLGAEVTVNPSQEDSLQVASSWSGGHGVDSVIFTAATRSSEPLSSCFKMCKRKGCVVLVGVSGMDIKREDIYKKELDFFVSTSYGPGRYDTSYEEKGIDYPYSYVRWTENRNMQEYLRLLSCGSIDVKPLIDSNYDINDITSAFERLNNPSKPLMVILSYKDEGQRDNIDDCTFSFSRKPSREGIIKVALVGAGGFATGMHLPNMLKLKNKYMLHAVMSRKGASAKAVAKQYDANYATTDFEKILNDPEVDLVLVATRHDSHAHLVYSSLKAGKNVFVEKPLATNQEELDLIKNFYKENQQNSELPILFTGFNRRFSDCANEAKKALDQRISPAIIHYRMNAGYIPSDHWVHENGGRIVGECCHIIDLLGFLVGSPVKSIYSDSINVSNSKYKSSDNKIICMTYHDGSIATIHYFSNGSNKISKEKMEVHFDGKSIVMKDYKEISGHGLALKDVSSKVSRKGQFEELEALYSALVGETDWPISLEEMIQTTEITFSV